MYSANVFRSIDGISYALEVAVANINRLGQESLFDQEFIFAA